jgi:hypothetical protein
MIVTGEQMLKTAMLARALLCVAQLFAIACGNAMAATVDHMRVIETPNAILRITEDSGNLVGIKWKNPELDVIREPRLGENFRVLLPKPGCEADYFYSTEQKVSRIEQTDDGVICHYELLRNAQEEVPVKVDYRIRAVGGQVQFSIEIENRTDRKLAEVFYGILGGLQGIGDRKDTETMIPGQIDNLAPAMFRNFHGGSYGGGNLGIRYDASGYTYPGAMPMGWMDVFNPKNNLGFYYANQDHDTRLTALYTELRPFTKSASVGDNWATPADVPPGEPIGMTIGWINFPYAGKGKFVAGPVALQVHTGDWHTASGIYREWFDQHFKVTRPASWLRKEMAWQSIILSNPEDVVVHRFNDLPRLAADAKKYGVTTFEILGWDMGGIDRGYPDYRPNPRLGTPEEFRQALAQMHKQGVHPLIFSNVQVADTATPLFRQNLSRYAVQQRWAPDWRMLGFGEGTISARMGLVQSNMAAISPSHPEFRKFLMDQYLPLVKDGADGFQFDKTTFDGYLDFNPLLPVSPDKSILPGVIATFQELLEKARKINPDFSLASEIWTDRALPYVDVSYMRMENIDMGCTALRYTFPEWTSTIFGESPGDFNPMNNGMRYGFVWALAPRHYNDSLDEPLTRPLSRYVSELIRIRTKYRDLLFHGRFNDTLDATVDGDADVRYSVFEPMQHGTGQRACVVVNYGDREETAEVRFPNADGREVEIAAPFEPERKAVLPARLSLPPRRCAVVVLR